MCLAIALYVLTATFGILSNLAIAIGIFLLTLLGRMIYYLYATFHVLVDLFDRIFNRPSANELHRRPFSYSEQSPN